MTAATTQIAIQVHPEIIKNDNHECECKKNRLNLLWLHTHKRKADQLSSRRN